jgi:hypothetical protein
MAKHSIPTVRSVFAEPSIFCYYRTVLYITLKKKIARSINYRNELMSVHQEITHDRTLLENKSQLNNLIISYN